MPLRARRRRIRFAIALVLLLSLAGAAWGVSYVSYLPRFSIQHVRIEGLGTGETLGASDRLVTEYVETVLNDGSYHFLSRSNVLLYPRAEIEHGIVAFFPPIASANAERTSFFSNELVITVHEREFFSLWCSPARVDTGAACYQMDTGGFIFAPAASTTATEYVFRGGIAATSSPVGETFVPGHLSALVALLNALGQAGFAPSGAAVESDTDFTVPVAGAGFIKVSFGGNPSTLVKNLQLVLSSDALRGKQNEIEYIDLRFGDRVYYKLKGQEQGVQAGQ